MFFENIVQRLRVKKSANVWDLVNQMHDFFELHKSQGKIIVGTGLFDGLTCIEVGEKIFWMLRSMQYIPDRQTQIIKTPYRFLIDGIGDCKSYSILAAAILAAKNIPVRFVYTNNDATDRPNHVFVQFQDCSGQIVTLDGTIEHFDTLPKFQNIWFGQWMQ